MKSRMLLPCVLVPLFGCLLVANAAPATTPAVDSDVDGKSRIAANPEDPAGYLQYAAWLEASGALDEAAAVLETGRNKADPSAELLVALGEVHEARGQVAKAETFDRRAREIRGEPLENDT